MAKKKHKTPPGLDHLFERRVISEREYGAFWRRYWRGDAQERRALVTETIAQVARQGRPVVGVVTRNRADAARQAQALSDLGTQQYRVVRRNANGRFSKRGTFYQAVKK